MIRSQVIPAGEGKGDSAAPTEYRSIDLADIRLDQSAQPRESLNTERTAEYAEAMKAGDKFPSLVVFFDGETYWLADGFHRHYAAQHARIKALSCRVLPGGLREAILFSVGANATHGLARTDEDKRRAVMRLLDDAEWSTWTDRDIAKRCRVSHPFVAKVRKAHAGDTGNVSSMERTYVHPKTGKQTTMKTAGINAGRAQFQAKASEDNGSITGGAGAVAGEASRLASGRTDAGEAASVDLPTNPTGYDAIVEAWTTATPEDRDAFIAYLRVCGFTITEQGRGNGPALPVETATEKQDACMSRPGVSETPATSSQPVTALEPSTSSSPEARAPLSHPLERGAEEASAISDTSVSSSVGARQAVPHSICGSQQARAPKPLMPHCLRPELCAGSGSNHCHACKKAMAEGEAA